MLRSRAQKFRCEPGGGFRLSERFFGTFRSGLKRKGGKFHFTRPVILTDRSNSCKKNHSNIFTALELMDSRSDLFGKLRARTRTPIMSPSNARDTSMASISLEMLPDS